MKSPYYLLLIFALVVGCSVLQGDDSEKEVRAFLDKFKASLTQPDEVILKQFDVNQSPDALVKLIRILQNKANEYIVGEFKTEVASITKPNEAFLIEFPVRFTTTNLPEYEADPVIKEDTLVMSVQLTNKEWKIISINGEEIYNTFGEIDNWIEWSAEHAREEKLRIPIYAAAKRLKSICDSVIWFTLTDADLYFYVVNGTWTPGDKYNGTIESDPAQYDLGLADSSGNLIVPIEFDMVTAPGNLPYNWLEVKKDGSYGIWGLDEKKLLIPAQWDLVIPYGKSGITAVVKRDSVYSWYDYQFNLNEGLPAGVETAIKNFSWLPDSYNIGRESKTIAEVLYEPGFGIYVTPSYLQFSGFLPEYLVGMSTTSVPMGGGREYEEIAKEGQESISDKLRIFFYSIKGRYLDGREEFYTNKRIVMLNDKSEVLVTSYIYASGQMSLKKISEELLEVKATPGEIYYDGELDEFSTVYQYYDLEAGAVTQRMGNTSFFPAEFVALDSSYFTGTFTKWNDETNDYIEISFFSPSALVRIRMELLALGGYINPDPQTQEQWERQPWYREQTSDEAAAMANLSPLLQQNLRFIDRMIALQTDPVSGV